MTPFSRLTIITLFAALSVAPPALASVDLVVQSAQLDPSKAESDAQRHHASGYCNLFAVAGYNWELPGLGVSVKAVGPRYTIIYIEDTSDAPAPEDEPVNARAKAYATTYNQAAVKHCGPVKQ